MLPVGLAHVLLGFIWVNGISGDQFKGQGKAGANQELLGSGIDTERYKTACPDYKHYAVVPQSVPFLIFILS